MSVFEHYLAVGMALRGVVSVTLGSDEIGRNLSKVG